MDRNIRTWWDMTNMDLGDLLAPEGIIPSLVATSKKQALQELAARAADMTRLDAQEIYRRALAA